MKIGIIGTGNIGAKLTHKFSAAGHAVQIAGRHHPQDLAGLARELGASATTLNEVGEGVDILITSIPFGRMPDLKPTIDRVPVDVPVADTSNYYPPRDGRIPAIDAGLPEGVWIEQRMERPVARAWNAMLQVTLADKGRPKGSVERLAIPVAGNDSAKQLLEHLVEDTGFDYVDAGSVEDAWRLQAGAPAYCTELNADQLKAAIALADQETVLIRREALLAIIGTWEPIQGPVFADILDLNRAAARLRPIPT